MQFTIHSAGGVASKVKLGHHEIVFDQEPPYGDDSGPSPLDVMVASVGACAHYYAAAFLQARKLPTEGVVVEVQAEKASDGLRRVGAIRVDVVLPSTVPDDLLPRLERVVRGCPAWGTMVEAPGAHMTVTRR